MGRASCQPEETGAASLALPGVSSLLFRVGILAGPPVPGGSLGVPGEGAHHLLERGNLFHGCLACFLAAVCGSALASSVHTL